MPKGSIGQFQHDLAYGRSALKSGLLEWEQTSRAGEHRGSKNLGWGFGNDRSKFLRLSGNFA